MKLILSTKNEGKVAELRALLQGLPLEVLTASDVPEAPDVHEDAPTLEGNALKKAQAWHALTGLPTLADDTGLEVEALGGRPGVYSARYAGPDADDRANRLLLLEELAGHDDRAAQFRTVLALIEEGGVHYFEGICRGRITRAARGGGGFGYDSLFVPEGEDRTFAELSPTEKNALSHRGRALRKVVVYLRQRLT